MLGTKMRALFQRRRGRDLFDLHWALATSPTSVDPAAILDSFGYYLAKEGTVAGRDEFIALLRDHLRDRGFCSDMQPLLRQDIRYDPQVAGEQVIPLLLERLHP